MLNNTSMKINDKISLFLFYLLLSLPILFGGNTKEIFEFPKTTALYILGGLFTMFFLLNVLGKKAQIILPNKVVTIFVMVNIIASIFSSHKCTSLWGYYSRFNGGLVSTLVFYFIYIVVLNNRKLYKEPLENIPLLMTIPVSIYAIFQHFSGTERAYSTIGQPNWLAAYMVMLIPTILKKYFDGSRKAVFLYSLAYATLWYTYSLSGMLGFVVATSVVLIQKRPLKVGKVAMLLLISSFISLQSPGIFKAKVTDLWVDVGNRITFSREAKASNSHTLSDPGFIRFATWSGTLNLITSSPKIFLIGTGPETFPYTFQKFRPKELNYSSEWDYIVNKPHNYYLQLVSELGIFSLLLYLIIIYENKRNTHIAGILGFAVTNIFGWPVVPTATLFWLWIAFEKESPKKIKIKTHNFTKVIPILFVFFLILKATNYYKADVLFMKSMDTFKKAKIDTSLEYANMASEKNKNEPNYKKHLGRVHLAKSIDEPKNKELSLYYLEKARMINPENLATKRDSISLYYFLAIKDMKETESNENNIDLEYIQTTQEYFNMLKEEHPTDAGTLSDIAKYENKLGLESYLKTKKMVENLRPDLITWHESFR